MLFYLQHTRSCACSAAGARGTGGGRSRVYAGGMAPKSGLFADVVGFALGAALAAVIVLTVVYVGLQIIGLLGALSSALGAPKPRGDKFGLWLGGAAVAAIGAPLAFERLDVP